MERAIMIHRPQGFAQEIRVRTEQIFPDPELLRALDDEPPFSRVLAFRKAEPEASLRLPQVREESGPR